MKIRNARQLIFDECNALYEAGELNAISWRILEHLSGRTRLEILTDKTLEIDETQLQQLLQSLIRNIPLQYVLGYEWFGGLKLKVNKDVLIPRPETEELTRLLIGKVSAGTQSSAAILDIGTGSACIPLLLKKELPQAEVFAMDVSEKALAVARENADLLQSDIHFIQADIRDEYLDLQMDFDFIISNPPYIMPAEKTGMHERVHAHEPAIALFVNNNDPLEFYKAILSFAKRHLKQQGLIFLEINQQYGPEIKILYESDGFHCEILSDMYGNIRFAIASKFVSET